MCQWFCCISDGKGNIFYFNAKQRQAIYDGGELPCEVGVSPIRTRDDLDGHSALACFYGLDVDKVNKYEFRPLDRKWIIDQINTVDDSAKVARKVRGLNFVKLAPPEMIFKPILHPFKDIKRLRATAKDIELLRQWASVRASVRDSVGTSIMISVGTSVEISVRDSVWISAGAPVGDSVKASVRDSAWTPAWISALDSVMISVGDSVWAYIGRFFDLPKWKYIDHKKGQYPFQPCVDLWERGIVPSFDGAVWRLHGHEGKIIKEVKL